MFLFIKRYEFLPAGKYFTGWLCDIAFIRCTCLGKEKPYEFHAGLDHTMIDEVKMVTYRKLLSISIEWLQIIRPHFRFNVAPSRSRTTIYFTNSVRWTMEIWDASSPNGFGWRVVNRLVCTIKIMTLNSCGAIEEMILWVLLQFAPLHSWFSFLVVPDLLCS